MWQLLVFAVALSPLSLKENEKEQVCSLSGLHHFLSPLSLSLMMMHAVVEYTCWLYHVCVCMYVLYECGETVGMVRMCVRHSACMSGVRREKKLSLYKPVLCSLTQNPIRSKRAKKKKKETKNPNSRQCYLFQASGWSISNRLKHNITKFGDGSNWNPKGLSEFSGLKKCTETFVFFI